MNSHIPRHFIDDLLTRIDIIDIIHPRVPLKKAGRDYTACCPFHNEKTPSFTVSPSKQFYHCFGCGAHGSAVTFLMEYDHLSFIEAIETLATQLGLDIPREQYGTGRQASTTVKIERDLFTLMQEAGHFYQQHLQQQQNAQTYLQQRGLTPEVIQQFQLGFAPDAWDSCFNTLGQRYSTQQLLDVGLLTENEQGKQYDRFRGRIMFPIRNRKGQLIGFGGRMLGDGKPKYLNSPETTLFSKSQELYGFYEARQNNKKLSRLVIVEGYMDVIALAQHGIHYCVATLGTATTKQHIQLLLRQVPEIIFCFDGDRAGREAAWRALENALPLLSDQKEIRFLFLPDGEDPDSLVREQGQTAFELLLDQAMVLSDYFLDHLNKQFNLSSKEGKARFLDQASQYLRPLPETLIKSQLISQMEQLTGVNAAIIRKQKLSLDQRVEFNQGEPSLTKRHLNHYEVKLTPVKYAIALLLTEPTLANLADNPEKIAAYELPNVGFFANLLEILQENPKLSAAALIERFRNTSDEALLTHLATWQHSSNDAAILAHEFQDCLRQTRKKAQEILLEKLLHKARLEGGLTTQEKHDLLILLNETH
ncbi:MAG TPA: DNA primase [Thiothrix sp.]|nr:DNA primase [Thiothrix sp.]